MAKSIWDDKPMHVHDNLYYVRNPEDVYTDDCLACKHSKSAPFTPESAWCKLKNVECGWGYTCKKFEKR